MEPKIKSSAAKPNGHEPATPAPEVPQSPLPELPPAVLSALLSEPDPYALLGREYARRIRLEGVVGTMQDYLRDQLAKK